MNLTDYAYTKKVSELAKEFFDNITGYHIPVINTKGRHYTIHFRIKINMFTKNMRRLLENNTSLFKDEFFEVQHESLISAHIKIIDKYRSLYMSGVSLKKPPYYDYTFLLFTFLAKTRIRTREKVGKENDRSDF